MFWGRSPCSWGRFSQRRLERYILLGFGMVYVVGIYLLATKQIFVSQTEDGNSAIEDTSLWSFIKGLGEEEEVEMAYQPPYTTQLHGESFRMSVGMLHRLGIPPRSYVTLNNRTVQEFVFVTAVDRKFFQMVISAVARIQERAPGYPIYVYDLGLTAPQVDLLGTWCNVVYRKFNFSGLPNHIRNLRTYAWKPLIMLEVLKTESGVFWVDSSVRLDKSDLRPLTQKALETNGGLLLSSTGHSTFAATHEDMYRFLIPRDMNALKREEQWESTALLFRTRPIMEHVLPWLAFCALQENCIAPTNRLSCRFIGDHYNRYANCHRFDQSAINILMMNLYNMSAWTYYRNAGILTVQRFKDAGKVKICSPDNKRQGRAAR